MDAHGRGRLLRRAAAAWRCCARRRAGGARRARCCCSGRCSCSRSPGAPRCVGGGSTRASAYLLLLVALPAELDYFAAGMALAVVGVAGLGPGAAPAWSAWSGAGAAFTRARALVAEADAARCSRARSSSVWSPPRCSPPRCSGVTGGGRAARLAWRPLAWVGLVSYGIYLWHLDVLRELAGDAGRRASSAPLARARRAAVLSRRARRRASWYLVERHAIRLGHRLRLRPPAGAARERSAAGA